MRRFTFLFLTLGLAVGSWWLWQNYSQVHDLIGRYIENSDLITLEARFTPEQIMEAHRKDLLGDANRTFKEPELRFHPYLFMDVKYTEFDKKPRESVILWGLTDGEMVINTDTWERTHGFEDAINSRASRSDFRIMNVLAKRNGSASIDLVQKELQLDRDALQPLIDAALEKHLVIQRGHDLILHLQNPRILVAPQTKIGQMFVNKPYSHLQRISAKYSSKQIKNVAKSAFGEDFTVRKSHEIYLPVYSIEVLNPDGSILVSYWNALNGQRIYPKYIAQN